MSITELSSTLKDGAISPVVLNDAIWGKHSSETIAANLASLLENRAEKSVVITAQKVQGTIISQLLEMLEFLRTEPAFVEAIAKKLAQFMQEKGFEVNYQTGEKDE